MNKEREAEMRALMPDAPEQTIEAAVYRWCCSFGSGTSVDDVDPSILSEFLNCVRSRPGSALLAS